MKKISTLLYFFLLFSLVASAQNLTGIWKGYFMQNNFGLYDDRYKCEIQLAQASNNALKGVTYSYKTTVFYGKTSATGIYTSKTNNILIDEAEMLDLKIEDAGSLPCLMTYYLEYNKIGNVETLTGTYSSRNLKDKSDCGSGKVYLERSETTDFYKEDFLVKREAELKKKAGKVNSSIKKPSTTNRPLAKQTTPKKPMLKPGAEANLLSRQEPKKSTVPVPKFAEPDDHVTTTLPPPPTPKAVPKPEVLRNRDNELVKTISTSAKEFTIDLYDNGEIDGDRISVYHNNQLIVSNKTLTDKPISFTIKADENTPIHEFVMVAENLGSIPPNTSLMIITAGGKRYELFVTSTEQKNAVVRVEYKPD